MIELVVSLIGNHSKPRHVVRLLLMLIFAVATCAASIVMGEHAMVAANTFLYGMWSAVFGVLSLIGFACCISTVLDL